MARAPALNLTKLARLAPDELKAAWARVYGATAPNLPPDLLRMGIGYRLQERRYGGLDRRTRDYFRQIGAGTSTEAQPPRPVPRKLLPGTRLVRDWRGTGHTVVVLSEGYEYNGRQWSSLSAIATAITGTRWSGPLFFGLTGRKRQ